MRSRMPEQESVREHASILRKVVAAEMGVVPRKHVYKVRKVVTNRGYAR